MKSKGKLSMTTATEATQPKKPRGRPPEHEMPERIDASPETIAEVLLQAKPKRTWRRYQQDAVRREHRGLARTQGDGYEHN